MDEAQVYIVRVWGTTSGPSGFRAAVRAVGQEESHLFSVPADVGTFLLGGVLQAQHPPGPVAARLAAVDAPKRG